MNNNRSIIIAVLSSSVFLIFVFILLLKDEPDRPGKFTIKPQSSIARTTPSPPRGAENSRNNHLFRYIAEGLLTEKGVKKFWGGKADVASTFLWTQLPIARAFGAGAFQYGGEFLKVYGELFSATGLPFEQGKINYLVFIESGAHQKFIDGDQEALLERVPIGQRRMEIVRTAILNSKETTNIGCVGQFEADTKGVATVATMIIDPSILKTEFELCAYNLVLKSTGLFRRNYATPPNSEDRELDKRAISILYSLSKTGSPFADVSPKKLSARLNELSQK